jgi:MYXO-CTERM domain-containing protein
VIGTSGTLTKSVAITLTVTGNGGAPGFMLTPTPGAVGVAQGATGTGSIALTALGGFSGNAELSASGAPAGVNVSFSPTSASATTPAAVVFTVGSSVTAGSYAIAIQGSGGGASASTEVWLVVSAGGNSGTGGHNGGQADGGTGGGSVGACGCGSTGPADLALAALVMMAVAVFRRRRSA